MAISDKLSLIKPSEIRRIRALAEKLENVISLTIGEPDFDTPEHIKEYAKEALDRGLTHYSPTTGLPEFKEALAEKLRKVNGIEADPEREIMVTFGSSEAFILSLGAILKDGDEVLIPTPTFLIYAPAVLVAGGKPVEVPMSEENEFKVTVEDLKRYITPKTKALIIVDPNNPTGSVLNRKDLTEIADFAVEHDLTIISDEVYEYLVYDDAKHYSLASFEGMFDRVVSVFSFSKTYAMTGWRLGYVVAREEIVNSMSKFQMCNCVCPVTFIQWAAMKALRDPRSEEAVERMKAEYWRRINLAYKRLNEIEGLSVLKPKGAFYVFPNITGTGLNDIEFSEWLLENARVAVVPGSAFGKGGENYVRISCASSYETLEEAFNRMESALKQKSTQR